MRFFIILRYLAFLSIALMVWNCQSDMPEPLRGNESLWQLSYEEEILVQSSNDMAFTLLSFLDNKYENQNHFFSPIGIGNGIGIAMNVINEESKLKLKKFLNIEEVSNVEINKAYSRLSELFGEKESNGFFVNNNSIWLNYNYYLDEYVANQLMAYYTADVEYLDFDKSKHLKAINKWVQGRTNGQVIKVLDQLRPQDKSYLINIMYLNPELTFDVKTQDAGSITFTNHNGIKKTVPAYKLEAGQYRIFNNEKFRLIDLPYGDRMFRFTIITTQKGIDPDELNRINRSEFVNFRENSTHTLSEIIIPRFNIDHELRLKELFPELILTDHSKNRDSKDIHSISEFIHRTSINLHETGNQDEVYNTEKPDGITNYNNPITIDQPFVFVIHENHTAAIFLVGKVNDPAIQ